MREEVVTSMLNNLFTIFATALSFSCFVYIFAPSKETAIHSAVVAFLISALLFYIDKVIKENGSDIINHIVYCFTKDGKYYYEDKRITYERKSDDEWELKKLYKLKSMSATFDEYDDRFNWSANSDACKICSVENGQKITRVREVEAWTYYTVAFDRNVPKGTVVDTGSYVTNLKDSPEHVKPFLTTTINRKTHILKMKVKIPSKYNPQNGKFSVYSSASSTSDTLVSSKNIEYISDEEAFAEQVMYPRKNWKYVITWEYKS